MSHVQRRRTFEDHFRRLEPLVRLIKSQGLRQLIARDRASAPGHQPSPPAGVGQLNQERTPPLSQVLPHPGQNWRVELDPAHAAARERGFTDMEQLDEELPLSGRAQLRRACFNFLDDCCARRCLRGLQRDCVRPRQSWSAATNTVAFDFFSAITDHTGSSCRYFAA